MTRRAGLHQLLAKVGRGIRELREARGLTQVDLGDLAQSNERVIGGIERGERNVSVANLFYIAAALGTTPGEILERVTTRDLKRLGRKPARRPGRTQPNR